MNRLALALAVFVSLIGAACAQGGMGPGPGTVHSTGGASASYSFVATDFTSQTGGGNFTSNAITPAGGTTGAHQLCIVGAGFQGTQGTITNFKLGSSANMTNVTGFGTLGLSSIWAGACTIAAGFQVTFTCSACGFSDINLVVWVADNLVSTTAVASVVTPGGTGTVTSAGGTVVAGEFVFAMSAQPGGGAAALSWSTTAQAPTRTSVNGGPFNTTSANADWIVAVSSPSLSGGNFTGTLTSTSIATTDAALVVYH